MLPRLAGALVWSVRSREIVNLTYPTTRESDLLLSALIATIADRPVSEMVAHLDELGADGELAQFVSRKAAGSRQP